jgi:hypothetical protein
MTNPTQNSTSIRRVKREQVGIERSANSFAALEKSENISEDMAGLARAWLFIFRLSFLPGVV